MAGRTKVLIDELVQLRTKGKSALLPFVRAQLMMRGINPDHHSATSADDARIVKQLEDMLAEFKR